MNSSASRIPTSIAVTLAGWFFLKSSSFTILLFFIQIDTYTSWTQDEKVDRGVLALNCFYWVIACLSFYLLPVLWNLTDFFPVKGSVLEGLSFLVDFLDDLRPSSISASFG